MFTKTLRRIWCKTCNEFELHEQNDSKSICTECGTDLLDVPIGNYLDDAINWFKNNDIPLHGINKNPAQSGWTTSPKAYGQLYIDDAALGVPLLIDNYIGGYVHVFVDWVKVLMCLIDMKILKLDDIEITTIITEIKNSRNQNKLNDEPIFM